MALTVDATGNPIKVTGDASTSEVVIAVGNLVKIRAIYWYKPTSAGHLCNILDGHGKDIIPLCCEIADKSQWYYLDLPYDGISIDDMDSGTLYIYQR